MNGDTDRRQIHLEGDTAIITKTAELCGESPGALDFEISFDGVDFDMGDRDDPAPDELIRWSARFRCREQDPFGRRIVVVRTGTVITGPGHEPHGRGAARACIDLLEQLGANVVVIDFGDTTDPRAGS